MNLTANLLLRTCAAAMLVAALAACDDRDSDDATPAPEIVPSEDVQESSWEDETDPELRLRGCLVGSFALDRDAWTAGLTEVLEGANFSSVSVEDSGEVRLDFKADQTYTLTARDSSSVSSGRSPDGDVRWVISFDGSESGTWAASSGHLSLEAGSGGRLAADHEVSIGGQPLPTDALPVSGTPWSETLNATCEVDGFVASPVDDPLAPEIGFVRLG